MKTNPRSIFRRSFLLAACLLSASYLGLASPASAAVVNALKNTSTITVDGNLNESVWTASTFTTTTRVVSGTGNNTVNFAVLWDATYLYVGIKVTDSQLFNDTANSGTPLNVWRDDSAEVYIDANNNNGTTYDSFDRQFVKGYNDTALANIGSATGVLHAWAAITGGYSVEMAIPWSNLGITPAGGTTTIGFDVGNNDDDNGGTTRESHLMWNGLDTNSSNTSQFGDCFLSNVIAGSPPAAPSGLTATTISSSQINLAWTDNANNETGVKVERKTGAAAYAQIALTGANATSYNNTGLSASTTYDYRVRATNGNGDSAYSNVASAATSGGATTTLWDTIGVFWDANLSNVQNFYTLDVKRTAAPKAAALVFFGNSNDWASWRSAGMSAIDTFKTWLQGGRRLVVSLRPWPDAVWPTYNLQGANTGAGYFSEYVTFFAQVKSYCDTNGIAPSQFIFRPAWEANGKFYSWTIDGDPAGSYDEGRTTAQRTADYKAMMQDIFAAVAQEMPGSIRDWNMLARKNTAPFVEAAYPGDAYVDVIDLDDYGTGNSAYGDGTSPWTTAERQAAWAVHTQAVSNPVVSTDKPNLAWQKQFASQHGKKVAFTEWGISWRSDNLGTQDDPIYINGMIDWMEQQLLPAGLMTLPNGDPTHACYFHKQATDAKHQLYYRDAPPDAYYSPNARNAFHSRVGGTGTPQ
ncbi:MAG: sugar-binding protein [Verrucomicrobiota bacterium]